MVFRELLSRGYTVTIGTFDKLEIDFVSQRESERQYILVTLSMLEQQARERELRPLRALRDAFPRVVITLDQFSAVVTSEGIRIVNAVDWLTGQDCD